MNIEKLEHELVQLKGQGVMVVVPLVGHSSISLGGPLEVVQNEDFACGFHVCGIGGWALIFFAEDVERLQPTNLRGFKQTIYLKKNPLKC